MVLYANEPLNLVALSFEKPVNAFPKMNLYFCKSLIFKKNFSNFLFFIEIALFLIDFNVVFKKY